MELEIIIITLSVIVIFVAFEYLSNKSYRRIIEKQEKLIKEQSDFIKVLERDYNILVDKQYQQLKNKINGQ